MCRRRWFWIPFVAGTVFAFVFLAWGGPARGAAPRFRAHAINAEATFCSSAAIDVDRDGRLDVVSGGFWYQAPHWKKHVLREVEVINGRYDDFSNLPLDVNGDGRLDLVSANYRSRSIYWVEQPSDPFAAWTKHVVDVPGPMETARLVDIDGDGRLDILPNGVQSPHWWEVKVETAGSGGSRPVWTRHDLPREVGGHGIGFGDVNGDGRGDIVGPRGWLEAPADRRRDRWHWHGEFEIGPDAGILILVHDVDGDGDADLIWGRGHRIGLYWHEQTRSPAGERQWVRHAIDTSWSQVHSLYLADLDNDGSPEVVTGKRFMGHEGRDPGEYDPLGVYAYAFDRTERVWRRSVLHAGGNVGFGLDPKVVDLDGDGDLDLICSARSGLYWLENLHIDGRREETAPPPATLPDAALASGDNTRLLVVRDEAGREQPVKTPLDWGRRRGKILADMEAAMGDLPDSSRRVPLDVKIVDEAAAVGYRRIRLTYAAEEGDRVPAYLLIPEGLKAKAPALLCLHPTNPKGKDQLVGASGESAPAYADELARRGYVCLVPDYPGFGEYAYDFQKTGKHYASGSMKAVWNNIRAIDLLEALPEVNGDRIGCVGHSLGGHNGLFTAAFDQRIAAVVTSCGFTALADYHGGRLDGWASDRYMPRVRAIYGGDASRMPFDFHEVLGALAPRPVYVVAPRGDEPFLKSGVEKVVAEARTVYALRGAEGALVADYPHGGHGFSDEARRAAYAWLDGQLKK